MSDVERVQKQCKIQLISILREKKQILAEDAHEILKRNPVGTKQLTVLLGSILKAMESTTAIVHLGEIGLSDEMNVLLRTLVELVINACYFQYSSDEELERYIHFDAIANHTAIEDFNRANKGRNKFAIDLTKRTKAYAEAANKASGLSLEKRQWNVETKTLKQRADVIDTRIKATIFAEFLATVYVTGSGYTHAGFKTLHKHAYYLQTGNREHPLETAYGVNTAIYGVTYALDVLGKYLGNRFGFPTERSTILSAEALRITEIAREDFKLYKRPSDDGKHEPQ